MSWESLRPIDALLVYLAAINVVTFLVYVIDKLKAIRGSWRVRESTLLGLAAAGGSVGALLGMRVAHHKVSKPRFRNGVPVILGVQFAAAAVLLAWFGWPF